MIQEKQSLGQELERQRLQVLELQDQLDVLRNQTTQERKMRANVALKISENIAQERESLVKELDMLRSLNTKVSSTTYYYDHTCKTESQNPQHCKYVLPVKTQC